MEAARREAHGQRDTARETRRQAHSQSSTATGALEQVHCDRRTATDLPFELVCSVQIRRSGSKLDLLASVSVNSVLQLELNPHLQQLL